VNGVPVRVSDVGYAEDSVQKITSSLFMADGTPAVLLEIRRASGENTIKVTEAVKRKLASIRQELPKTSRSPSIRTIRDSSTRRSPHSRNISCGGSLLASLVVMFFIRNIRAVIISSLAIPASIIATFTLMRAMDFTLNNMTLLALTLAVGIVIDDAIVVLENIFRYIEEKHLSPFDAAIQGTREVALPVMATTLALIVIFLPVAFMTGYARRFIYPFGWTMAFAILVSMIVSFTLTPMLSSRFLTASAARADEETRHHGFLPRTGPLVHPMAAVDPRASDGDHRCFGGARGAHRPAESHGGTHLCSRRGHERVHGARRHAAGNLDRRDDGNCTQPGQGNRRVGRHLSHGVHRRGRPIHALSRALLSASGERTVGDAGAGGGAGAPGAREPSVL
jgi:multidrug efflux pump subunit AcrB